MVRKIDLPLLINFEDEKIGEYNSLRLKKKWNNPPALKGIKEGRFKVVKINGKKVLQASFPKGSIGPREGGGSWKLKLGKSYDELYLQYSVLFPKGFNFVRGGKLPGLSGGSSPAGGSKELDGFSARIMWRVNHFENKHNITNPYRAYLCQYVYYPKKDPNKRWGLDLNWSNSRTKSKVYIIPGKWHTIKIKIKLNSRKDLIESWLDGKKVLSKRLTLRDKGQKFSIENLYFSTFFGGDKKSWSPKKTEKIYFNNFIISEKDII